MRVFSLKQTVIAILVIAILLVALVGGVLRIGAARSVPTTPHSSHPLAWYCPPPPIVC